jgi:hypothetical protein
VVTSIAVLLQTILVVDRPWPRLDGAEMTVNRRRSNDHLCMLRLGFFEQGGRTRSDDLPITSRMLGVDLDSSRRVEPAHLGCLIGSDGSRRIQKDRRDSHRDDQGPSDRTSDGKASNSVAGHSTPPPAPGWRSQLCLRPARSVVQPRARGWKDGDAGCSPGLDSPQIASTSRRGRFPTSRLGGYA